MVAGALKHWKGRRDAGAPAAALVGIVGKAAEGVHERREEGHDERVEVHVCVSEKTVAEKPCWAALAEVFACKKAKYMDQM